MKQRFSSLDVKVIARELAQSIIGLRIANIYDLSTRICLFKLQQPDIRKQLVIDPGFRCHLSEYARTAADTPSPFIARLRKFLKTRRITNVSQVGTDRVIHFEISDGQFHLFLEFFAAGNVILTDADFKIVALLRIVPEAAGQEEVKLGLRYNLASKQNYNGVPDISEERLRGALDKAVAAANEEQQQPEEGAKKKKKKSKTIAALRRALSSEFPEFPPLLLDHAFHVAAFDSSIAPSQVQSDPALFTHLMRVLETARDVTHSLSTSPTTPGYIICAKDTKDSAGTNTFEDFHPFIPSQFSSDPTLLIATHPTFNKAVDEYYSTVESQRLESKLGEREATAKRKLESARKDHEKRLGALQEVQELHVRKAQAIELGLEKVQAAINAVNALVAQGMDWVEIARLIEMEQERGNPVAGLIKLPLKLYENTVTVALPDPAFADEEGEEEEEEEESEEETESESDDDYEKEEKPARPAKPQRKPLSIDIDLGLSPYANARQYYDQKKVAADKKEKTLKASKKALESHEKKVAADLKRGLKQEKPVLRLTRTPFWFEKFLYFISSEGYLILGGKDPQQAELLYLYYLNKGDVYVHADIDKAVPLIVKNNPKTPNAPIPPTTLMQAGAFSVASSKAWDTKALMGAWWVAAEQVSKTTAEGEYLTNGSVVIEGEKNMLPPSQLVLGFAVMWQVSEESVGNHRKHRVLYVEEEEEGEGEREESPVGQEEHAEEESAGEAGEQQSDAVESKADVQEGANVASSGDVNEEHAETEVKETAETEGKEDLAQSVKDMDLDDSNGDDKEEEEPQPQPTPQPKAKQAGKSSQKPSNTPPAKPQKVRGKRGKLQKIAEKYKDQDEEDRANALAFLGSTGKKEPATAGAPTPSANATGAAPPRKGKNAPTKTKEERDAEVELQKARRRAQHEKAAKAERERLERLHREAGAEDSSTEAGNHHADLSMLPCLVGAPVVGDEVLAALPVCAPWSALSTYKLKTKLQPGPVKRGKAVKEMVGKWVVGLEGAAKVKKGGKKEDREEKAEEEERQKQELEQGEEDPEKKAARAEAELAATELELVKAWKDTEGVNCLPVANMRIVSGAGDGKGKGGGGKGGGAGGKPGKAAKGGKGPKANKKKR